MNGRRLRTVLASIVATAALGVSYVPPAYAERVQWRPVAKIASTAWPFGVGGVQGAQWYHKGAQDRWVVSRYRGGHSVFHLFDQNGRLLSTMRLAKAGHPSQFAVKYTGRDLKILVRWGHQARWVVWRSGMVHRGNARVRKQPTPGITNAHVALSENRRWLIARKQRADGREEYRLFRRYVGRVVPVSRFVRNKPTTHQGFATDGRYVYVLYGATGRRAFLDRLNARTGAHAGRVGVGLARLRSARLREPEGLGWRHGKLLLGNREGGANRHRIVSVGEVTYRPWGL